MSKVVLRQFRFKIMNEHCVDYNEWYPWENCTDIQYNDCAQLIKSGKTQYEIRELIVKET